MQNNQAYPAAKSGTISGNFSIFKDCNSNNRVLHRLKQAEQQLECTCEDHCRAQGVGFTRGVSDGDEGAGVACQAAAQFTALHALLPPWHCLQLLQVPAYSCSTLLLQPAKWAWFQKCNTPKPWCKQAAQAVCQVGGHIHL